MLSAFLRRVFCDQVRHSNCVTTNNDAYALVAMTMQFFCTRLVFLDLSAVCMRAHLQCCARFLSRDVCPDSINARWWRYKCFYWWDINLLCTAQPEQCTVWMKD